MMELLYPIETAPVIGEKASLNEMLPVVDRAGVVYEIGRASCRERV